MNNEDTAENEGMFSYFTQSFISQRYFVLSRYMSHVIIRALIRFCWHLEIADTKYMHFTINKAFTHKLKVSTTLTPAGRNTGDSRAVPIPNLIHTRPIPTSLLS